MPNEAPKTGAKSSPKPITTIETRNSRFAVAVVIVYVTAALAVDFLATRGASWPINWSVFRWNPYVLRTYARALGIPDEIVRSFCAWPMQKFDFFKFLIWLLVPFLFSVRRMDWGALGVRRWKRMDGYFLLALALAGLAAVLIIPYVPALRNTYPGMRDLAFPEKWAQLVVRSLWVLSWLLGWEFLHRYFLIRSAASRWPRYGWLLVPLSEGLYHLQKPSVLEAVGMVALSVLLTQWTLRRRNVLLPFLVHLTIEIELIVFVLFF